MSRVPLCFLSQPRSPAWSDPVGPRAQPALGSGLDSCPGRTGVTSVSGPPPSLRRLSWLLGRRALGSESPKPPPLPSQAGCFRVAQERRSKSRNSSSALPPRSMCSASGTCSPSRAGLLRFATLSLFLTALSLHWHFTSRAMAPVFGAACHVGPGVGCDPAQGPASLLATRGTVGVWASASPPAEQGWEQPSQEARCRL